MSESLAEAIAVQLRRTGSARSHPNESTTAWRTAARAAARQLGRPVRTLEHDGIAHAVLRDWPANDLEEQIHREALRAAVQTASDTGPTD